MKYLKMMSLLILAITMVNCSDDDEPSPAVVDFTADVNGTEVTFSSTMSNVETFEWVFGDGNKNSTDKNPVYAYETPGTYKVILNALGNDGKPVAIAHDVEVLETPEYLLTGGAAHPAGKTWRMKYGVSDPIGKEGVGGVENTLAVQIPIDEPGFLEYISLPQGYNDTFTFVYDGAYKVDNADNYGGSLMALIYANMNHVMEAYPAGDVLGISSEPYLAPMGDIVYSPKTDATWAFSSDNFDVDAAIVDPATGEITQSYTMNFSGHQRLVLDEYLGFKDATIVVILKEISETEMTVAIAMHAAQADPARATHMVHLTFVAVPFP